MAARQYENFENCAAQNDPSTRIARDLGPIHGYITCYHPPFVFNQFDDLEHRVRIQGVWPNIAHPGGLERG
jgi:hypothetical protein